MCEERRPDYLDEVLGSTSLQVVRIKETPCPLPEPRPIVVVYARAENVPSSERTCDLEIVKLAASEAYRLLVKRENAVNAVETAIKSAEAFYRGFETMYDENKEIECDAGILEGNYLNIGSVGGVKKFDHPISLAKYVMRKTDHVLIVSEGAEYLAEELDVEDKADKTSLIEAFTNALKNMKDLPKTDGPESEKEDVEKVKDGVPSDRAKIDAQESKKEGNIENKGNIEKKKIDELSDGAKTDVQESKMEDKIKNKEDFDEEKDDVPNESKSFGAVAYDIEKQISCGLSVFRKDPKSFGRLNASATVVGCGFYGTKDACICVSGDDRTLYTQAPARAIIEGITDEVDLRKSMELQLDSMSELTGDKTFGTVAIEAYGSPVIVFRAKSFPWAYCKSNTMFYGASSGEYFCEKVKFPKDDDESTLKCCCDEEPEKKIT